MQKKLFPFLLVLFAGASPVLSQQPALEQPVAEQPAAPEKPAEVAPAHSAEEEMAALRPVLIGRKYLNQARQRLAVQLARMSRSMDDPGPWVEDNALVVRDFFADVQIMYALEFEEGAQLVSHGMMKRWGMDADRLHQRALANLDRTGEIGIKQVGKLPWLNVIETDDGYAASRVLLHWRWAELTLKLGNLLILGMPTHDVVVFTATLEPQKIEQLRETVDTVERHQGRPISRKLFQWTPQGWMEFDPPLQQTEEQRRQQGEQDGGAEGKMVGAAAKADADIARPAADAQQGGQARQENAGDEHRNQQDDQPLQHGNEEKSGTTEERR
jgi:hypothetical protein